MSNEIAEREEQGSRSLSEIVRQGADLPAEWNAEKIAAAKKMLPKAARNPSGLIAYLSRATNAGLDPFQGEIHAWEDKGELTFHVAREGWVKILRRDPEIESFEINAVYEEDNFVWKKDPETGSIQVDHSGGIRRGDLLGAYCVLHMKDQPDHIEMRLLEDYDHLSWKDNWENHPQDMLTARVTSAAAKARSSKAAGLVDTAGLQMGNAGQEVQAARNRKVEEKSADRTDELASELADEEEELEEAIEAEAKVVDDETPSPEDGPPSKEDVEDGHDVGQGESDRQVQEELPTGNGPEDSSQTESESEESSETSSETTPSTSDDEELESTAPDIEPCDLCGREDFKNAQAKSGHTSGHSKRDETIPEGYKVRRDEDGHILLLDPDGVVLLPGPDSDGYESGAAARQAAWEDVGADPAGAADEAEEPEQGEDAPQEEVTTLKQDTPLSELSSGSLFSELYTVEQHYEIEHGRTLEIAQEVAPEKAEDAEDFSIMTLSDEQKIEVIKRLHAEGK